MSGIFDKANQAVKKMTTEVPKGKTRSPKTGKLYDRPTTPEGWEALERADSAFAGSRAKAEAKTPVSAGVGKPGTVSVRRQAQRIMEEGAAAQENALANARTGQVATGVNQYVEQPLSAGLKSIFGQSQDDRSNLPPGWGRHYDPVSGGTVPYRLDPANIAAGQANPAGASGIGAEMATDLYAKLRHQVPAEVGVMRSGDATTGEKLGAGANIGGIALQTILSILGAKGAAETAIGGAKGLAGRFRPQVEPILDVSDMAAKSRVQADPVQVRYNQDKADYDELIGKLTEEKKDASPSRRIEIADEIKNATAQFQKIRPKPAKPLSVEKLEAQKGIPVKKVAGESLEPPVGAYIKTGPKAPVETPKPGPVIRTNKTGKPSFITSEDAKSLRDFKDSADPAREARTIIKRASDLSKKYAGNQDALNEILDIANARKDENPFKGATQPGELKGALKQSIENLGGTVPKVVRGGLAKEPIKGRALPGPKFKGGSRGSTNIFSPDEIDRAFRAASAAGKKTKEAALKWIGENADLSGDMSGWSNAYDSWAKTAQGVKTAVTFGKKPAEKEKPGKTRVILNEAGSIGRQLQATGDVSGSRNVKMLGAAHPGLKVKTEIAATKGMFNPEASKNLANQIQNATGQQKKLYKAISWDRMDGLGESAEQFGSGSIENIPVIGKAQGAFERNFSMKTNGLRKEVADSWLQSHPNMSDAEIKDLGQAIDLLSSKGFKSSGGVAEKVMNSVLFSPKAQAAKFRAPVETLRELGKSAKAGKMTPAAKLYTRAYASHVATGLTTLAAAKAFGADVSLDPNSSDFGKIKIGNRRFDIWQGEGGHIRLFVKAAIGAYKNAIGDTGVYKRASGEHDAGDKKESAYTQEEMGNDLWHWIRYKTSPNVNLAASLITKQDALGRPVSRLQTMTGHVTPMLWKDAFEGGDEESKLLRAVSFLLNATGGTTSSYYKDKETPGANVGRKGS